MDRHERFRSELAAGLVAEKKRPTRTGDALLSAWTDDNTVSLARDDRRHKELHRVMSRGATATARVSPLREPASARNSAGDVAPSYFRGQDGASRTRAGRGSKDGGDDNREDTRDDRRRGRRSSRKDFKGSRERRPGDRPSAATGPRWDDKSDDS